MSDNIEKEVATPCIGVCMVDEAGSGLCQGCYRTLDEIKAWWNMTPQEQRDLLVALQQRQA